MNYLDLTLDSPAENLACDEALLDQLDNESGDEVLRFWEAPQHFVVVGYANHVGTEVDRAACERRGVPILRRCTGGGTVLQGPGCLNYSLILRATADGPLANVTSTNRFVMERHRETLERLLNQPVTVRGCTDLTLGDIKFSGNAQRRKKNAMLFHGTFLLHADMNLLSHLLRMPTQQPVYRRRRTHADFVTNLNISAKKVQDALKAAWKASESGETIPRERIGRLARDKYATSEWNFKF
jgi:lipoate-protein ligase A